jgi:hypothetical protein
MTNQRDALLKILETIGYEDNRESFVDEFLNNVQLQSLTNLIQSLPQEKQNELKDQLKSNSDNSEVVTVFLKDHLGESKIQEVVKQTTEDAVVEYIQQITPSLSDSQRRNLTNVLQEFGQPST